MASNPNESQITSPETVGDKCINQIPAPPKPGETIEIYLNPWLGLHFITYLGAPLQLAIQRTSIGAMLERTQDREIKHINEISPLPIVSNACEMPGAAMRNIA